MSVPIADPVLRQSVIPDILHPMQEDEPTHPRSPSTHRRASITMQAAPDQLAAIDAWIEEDGARFDRSEAVRALVDHALGRTVASRGVRALPPLLRPLDDVDTPA